MYFQKTNYTCGPASIRIAMRALGHTPISEKQLEEICGTTPAEGTDEEGIKRALLHYGCTYHEINTDSVAEADMELYGTGPVILCLDKWTHWACVIGWSGNRVIVADPARYGYNTKTNGILMYDTLTLLRRWRRGKRKIKDGGAFYGIAVYKK